MLYDHHHHHVRNVFIFLNGDSVPIHHSLPTSQHLPFDSVSVDLTLNNLG